MSCTSSRDSSGLSTRAEQAIGTVTDTAQSPGNRYILYLNQKQNPNTPDFVVDFVVFDQQVQKKIYQDTVVNTNVSWLNDSELLLRQRLGILTKSGKGYKDFVLNISTGKKHEKNTNNQ